MLMAVALVLIAFGISKSRYGTKSEIVQVFTPAMTRGSSHSGGQRLKGAKA
jgi:hypothetical protein